ncbi:hypothetical protein NOF55_18340 [Rhizobiaceae bacterium BDR2-2]|uniref:Uncharacterized protein n=1 Tax=Ectorhizobium quercum TaxID=2965071 RepID=A0AAE3SY23_9HYPH|nr:hypothetical protein [Ectorhizobium quercum]MCX8999070.1 hypothetical protein [Ectorhizobium quercum]
MPNARAAASHSIVYRLSTILALTLCLSLGSGQAFALSQLRSVDGEPATPGQAAGNAPALDLEGSTTPQPGNGADGSAQTESETPAVVEYSHDAARLPEPVRRLREKIIEAAVSGDPERLRPLIGTGDERTQIPSADDGDDPINALKAISGDEDGVEVLAIILDLISSGYARVNPGTADEIFIWPYFAEKDIQTLSPPEKVELLRIVTAGDLMGMQEYGGYNFFQMGLTPDGRWKFLTAGD